MHPKSQDADQNASTSASSETHERKRRELFDCLLTAEQGLKGSILEQAGDSPTERRIAESQNIRTNHRLDVSQVAIREKRFRGEESIFKKPPPGIMKCLKPRRTPDYQANPHKWKKYSLSDADTSDRTNTAAAFEFLKQIEERKQDEAGQDDAMDTETDGKIVFKQRPRSRSTTFNQSAHLRPIVESGGAAEEADKPVLKGSKVVMPEYVVGQRVAKEKKARSAGGSSKACAKNQLKLGHLFEEDGEED